MTKRGPWLLLAVLVLATWSWTSLDLEAARLEKAPGALSDLAAMAWPPETGGEFLQQAGSALLETVHIAILATLFGSLLSLPLALAAANNLAPPALVWLARLFASAVRVLPSLVWAIFAVLVVGLGPLAGVVAMTFYTIGYLSKLQYEAIEGIPRDGLDAVRAMGASRFQQAWHVALPEAANSIRSQILFMFEYNVRASSIIGLVGAGGIGQLLAIHLKYFDYAHVFTIVLMLFLAVAALDVLSLWVRRRFLELSDARRPRWQDVVVGSE